MHMLTLKQTNNITNYQKEIEKLFDLKLLDTPEGSIYEERIHESVLRSLNFLKRENNVPLNICLIKFVEKIESKDRISEGLKNLVLKIQQNVHLFFYNNLPDSDYKFFFAKPHSLQLIVKKQNSTLKLGIDHIESFFGISNHPKQIVSKRIDFQSIQYIKEIFGDIFPDIKTIEPPSLTDLNIEYRKLHFIMSKHLLKAKESGKKALFLVGESHDFRKSLLWEFMIMDIAKKLKIENFIVELDNELLNESKNKILDSTDSNFYFYIKLAQELNFKIIPGDPKRYLYTDDDCKERNDGINGAIYDVNQDVVSINGSCHLIHICKNKSIRDRYEILALNASYLKSSNHYILTKTFEEEKEAFDFLEDKEKVVRLDISGNACMYDFSSLNELKEIIKKISIKNENSIRVEQRFVRGIEAYEKSALSLTNF